MLVNDKSVREAVRLTTMFERWMDRLRTAGAGQAPVPVTVPEPEPEPLCRPDCCDATLEAIEVPPVGVLWFPCQWFKCSTCGLEWHYTPEDPDGWRWTSDCGCGILDQ